MAISSPTRILPSTLNIISTHNSNLVNTHQAGTLILTVNPMVNLTDRLMVSLCNQGNLDNPDSHSKLDSTIRLKLLILIRTTNHHSIRCLALR